jgi:hypothetical protein
LLLIVPSFAGGEMKGVKRVVMGGCAVDWLFFLFLLAIRRASTVSKSSRPGTIGYSNKDEQSEIT